MAQAVRPRRRRRAAADDRRRTPPRRRDAPRPGDRRLGGAHDPETRNRGTAGTVRVADLAWRDHLVPTVLRARGRLRPGLVAYARGSRRRWLAAQRAEGV